jgi:hypothetical protein
MTSVLIGLGILSVAMILLETVWPGIAGQCRLRRGWLLDVIYWFFTALITKPIAKVAVVVALVPLLFTHRIGIVRDSFKRTRTTRPPVAVNAGSADDRRDRF